MSDFDGAPEWLRRNFAAELESEAAEQLKEDLEDYLVLMQQYVGLVLKAIMIWLNGVGHGRLMVGLL